jgi:hypothetical protein
MGRMKELFTEYQQQMTGSNAEFIDDEYHFQKWVEEQVDNDGWTPELEEQYWKEQPPYPFATDVELEQMYSASIFPDDMFYDDEYYKSTYHPTKEDEEEAFKLFNKQ